MRKFIAACVVCTAGLLVACGEESKHAGPLTQSDKQAIEVVVRKALIADEVGPAKSGQGKDVCDLYTERAEQLWVERMGHGCESYAENWDGQDKDFRRSEREIEDLHIHIQDDGPSDEVRADWTYPPDSEGVESGAAMTVAKVGSDWKLDEPMTP